MNLSSSEKIRLLLGRRGMTLGELADRIGSSRQNLSNKMARSNFSEKELQEIAAALGCKIDFLFTMNDSGETI